MGLAVGDIVELVGPDRAVRLRLRKLFGEAARDLHVVVGIAIGLGRNLDQLRAHQAQRILLFLALRFGNHDHGAEAEGIADDGQPDSRVAGRALDDHAAGFELALGDRVLDDEKGRAILHGLARIHELRLAQDLAARELGGALEANERGLPDGGDGVASDVHGPEW